VSKITVKYWSVPLSTTANPGDCALLGTGERERAKRFVFAEHAARFVTARAALRRILGLATGIRPEEVAIVEGAEGRPELRGLAPPLHFNLSHSGDVAVIALCREAQVGVDVEHLRPIEKDLVERFFSPAEQAALAALSGEDWLRGFYRCWTRKEAFVKGLGQGLLLPLDEFDVSIGKTPALLRCSFAPVQDWAFAALPVRSGYEAVVAVEAKGAPVVTEARPGSEIN
jgi:4'-phosphopantetheinyl transferase